MANAANITRRNILKAAAAGSAVALPAVAVAAASEDEHPWVRARRLADELSSVLNEINGGAWSARVYPNNHPDYREFPIAFIDIDADNHWRTQVAPEFLKLIEAHKKAYSEFSDEADADDVRRFGRWSQTDYSQRWMETHKAEGTAFNALLRYSPSNSVTSAAKADYLREFYAHSVMNEDQIKLLIDSLGGRAAS